MQGAERRPGGNFFRFEVGLNPRDPNYSAFMDLDSFLQTYSSPDKWLDNLIGWVSLWDPVETLLFDPIPIKRENEILEYIMDIDINIQAQR